MSPRRITMTEAERERMLDILSRNSGFADPAEWLRRAAELGFEEVPASPVRSCPDCGSTMSATVTRVLHYSTSIGLRRCLRCRLVFANTRLDAGTTSTHFETAYKDEDYFASGREAVFEQLAGIAGPASPLGGRVLDIGGAKGHLLVRLREERPDLDLVLTDISGIACRHARERHGLCAVEGGLSALERLTGRFDAIILSDVLYYEPELARLWRTIVERLNPKGALVLRLPNHYWLTVIVEGVRGVFRSARARRASESAFLFNPEHLYIFSRDYLSRRLAGLGFTVEFRPSALTHTRALRGLQDAWLRAADAIWRVSKGAITTTPSMIVVAKRRG
ncbi:MAG: class I SAM-dependent methyltransferase [Gemmatimonadaceae bacterium]